MVHITDAEKLYEGGWRAKDVEELANRFGLSDDEAEEFARAFQTLASGNPLRWKYIVTYGQFDYWEGEDEDEAHRQYLACGPYGNITQELI